MGEAFRLEDSAETASPVQKESKRFGLARRAAGVAVPRPAAPVESMESELAPARTRSSAVLDPHRTGGEAAALEANLKQMVVGQDEAIAQIVNIYQMHLTGMSAPQRPVGNFLFLGPTGSGKTRIVEATAEALTGTSRAMVKIDCAEFQHSHEIAKLIGSPPGYLGHRETHPLLSQEVLNQYQTERVKLSFVLFDEIEKASDALWNLLLGILDKGTLTLGDNRKVDFTRTMIFMTSNLGAKEMSSAFNPSLGFSAAVKSDNGTPDAATTEKIARAGVEAARRKFTPEFMNRLDKVVAFNPLGAAELRRVLDIELGMVQQRVFGSGLERSFVFTVSDEAKRNLLEEGTDIKYGARHLKRAIERLLVQPMSNLIATGQVRGGDLLRVDFDEPSGELSFVRQAEDLPVHAMVELVDTPVRTWMRAAGAPEKPVAARGSRRG